MGLVEQLHHSANRVERDAVLGRQTTRARVEEVREEHHALTSPREKWTSDPQVDEPVGSIA